MVNRTECELKATVPTHSLTYIHTSKTRPGRKIQSVTCKWQEYMQIDEKSRNHILEVLKQMGIKKKTNRLSAHKTRGRGGKYSETQRKINKIILNMKIPSNIFFINILFIRQI